MYKRQAAAFATDGEAVSCQRYGSGHINDTFRLICEKHPYILQRMNTDIFQDPVSLMRNIEGVTTFLRQEVMKNNGDPDRETLNPVSYTHLDVYKRQVVSQAVCNLGEI